MNPINRKFNYLLMHFTMTQHHCPKPSLNYYTPLLIAFNFLKWSGSKLTPSGWILFNLCRYLPDFSLLNYVYIYQPQLIKICSKPKEWNVFSTFDPSEKFIAISRFNRGSWKLAFVRKMSRNLTQGNKAAILIPNTKAVQF